MADYIPDGDAELVTWATQYVAYATLNLVALGMVAGDLTPITAALTAYQTKLNQHAAAQAAAISTTAAKNAAGGVGHYAPRC